MGDAGIPGPPTVFGDNLRDIGTTKLYPLGAERRTFDGDIYVYVKAGAVTLAASNFCTYLTSGTNDQTVVTAHPIGTTVVTVTDASCTANQYEDGYLIVTAGTGIGECYRIKSNTVSDGTYGYYTLYEGLATAWSVSDTDVSVFQNRYKGLIKNPHDAQQRPVCVTQWPITALYYGWALRKGYGALTVEVLAAGGAELDEKLITASVTDTTNAGRGTLTGSATNTIYASATAGGTTDDSYTYTAAVYQMQPVLAHVVQELDCTNDEATLVCVDL